MPVKIKLFEMMAKRNIRTIEEMSKKSELSRKSISKILGGEVNKIHLDTIYKICRALDCEVGDLIVHEKEVSK